MAEHLLPGNATPLERAVSETLDRTTTVLGPGADSVRGIKYTGEIEPSFAPWVAIEYGLGSISAYFDDIDELIAEGIPWQRVRGTPEAIERALGWIDYTSITLLDQHVRRRKWNRFQLDMGKVPAIELPVLMDAEYLGGLSSPARSVFYRGFHGYDVRALEWGDGRWGDMLWGDDSGVRLPGGTVKWSHGEDDEGVVDLSAEQQEALGLTLSGGWDPIPWDAPGQAWGQVTDMPALQSYLLRRLPMRMGFFDGGGEAIGYRRPIAVRDVTADHEPGGTTIHVEVEARTGFGDGVDPVSGEGADAAAMAVVARAGNADPAKPGKLWLRPPELAVENGYDLAAMTLPSVPVDFRFRKTVRQHAKIRIRSLAAFGADTPAGMLLGDAEPVGFAVDFAHDSVLIRWPGHGQFVGTVQDAIDAGILVFTRASGARRFNASKLYESVASGVWRLQHDPLTGEPLGYLPEPQRTNLWNYSSLAGTGWTPVNATRSASPVASPSGALDAVRIKATATSFARVEKTSPPTLGAATAYADTIFARAGSTNFLHGTAEIGGVGFRFFCNLSTGAVSTASFGVTATMVSKRIANDWYEIEIRWTAPSALAYNFFVGPSQSMGSTSAVVGQTIDVWDAQREAGAYATSLNRTSGSTATRAADAMYADLSKLPFDAAEFTALVTAQPCSDASSNLTLLTLSDGTSNNAFTIRSGTAGQKAVQHLVQSGGAVSALITSAANDQASRFKAAFALKANDFELVANGQSRGTDNAGAMPVAPNILRFTSVGGTGTWGAPIESLVLIPRRLPLAGMISRTAA